MTIELKPEMEALVQKRLETGAFATPEEVIERALEFLSAEEDWLADNRDGISAKIQEGWDQAQRGELLDGGGSPCQYGETKQGWPERQSTARAVIG